MKKYALFPFVLILLTACSAAVDAPPDPTSVYTAVPQATAMPVQPSPTPQQQSPSVTDTPAAPTASPDFCQDTRDLQLLSDLQTAIQTRDGELLASLVSPASGVGVRYLRNGNVITYFDNIKFVFETAYEADWGLSPGSGAPLNGSFHEIVLPSLELVLASDPVVTCNELKTGGATYVPEWPYQGMDYYSVHFPGTDEFSGMNWETWAVGMVVQEGKPMLAALVRFAWEP